MDGGTVIGAGKISGGGEGAWARFLFLRREPDVPEGSQGTGCMWVEPGTSSCDGIGTG